MKTNLSRLAFIAFAGVSMLAATSAFAQHRWQVDDGAGHYTILTGQTINALDNFTFPAGGGTVVTTGGGGPSLGWLTAGNTLSGGEKFGSLNGFDVVMYANNSEKLRLSNGGGVSVTGGLTLNGLTTGIAHVGVSGAVTSSLIVNADVSPSAAIAYSKLNLANSIVTGDIVDAQITLPKISATGASSGQGIIYNGTNIIWGSPSPGGAAGGDLTGTYPNPTIANSAVTSAKILDGTIVNADVSPTAAIAYSKLNLTNSIVTGDIVDAQVTLPKISPTGAASGQAITYNGTNIVWGSPSPGGAAGGDLTGTYPNPTIAANAVTSAKIADGTIVNADVSPTAAIAYSKMQGAGAAGGDLSGSYPNPGVAKINGNAVPANAAGTLTNDGAGNLSWTPVSSSAWALGGNNTPSSNIFGTTSATDVDMRANNTTQMTLRNAGGINIPTTTSAGVGAIFMNGARFLHNYNGNLSLGDNAGNFTATNAVGPNTAIGSGVLQSLTTGNYNVGVGTSALANTTGGGDNTAVGAEAMVGNTTGTANTAVGRQALFGSPGQRNVAMGIQAGLGTSGNDNTIIGAFASTAANANNNNTAIGKSALANNAAGNNTGIGYNALGSTTSGPNNSALGINAGATNTTGSGNTLLGAGADVGAVGLTNATAVGQSAIVSQSNSLVLGNSANVGIGTSSPSQLLEVQNGNALLSNNNNIAAELRLAEPSGSGSNFTSFKAQAQATDVAYTLPAADGTSGQVLSTNGSGLLSWATAAGGASGPAGGDLTGTYPNPVIAANAVTSAKIADGTITNADISAAAAIAYSKLNLTGSIVGSDIAAGTFTTTNAHHAIGNNDNTARELRLLEPSGSGVNYTAFKAQAQAADITYTLPSTAGTNGQVLKTNGSNVLSWSNDIGGSFSLTSVSANYTATNTDQIVQGVVTGGGFTITLPNANTFAAGQTIILKQVDPTGTGNTITIATTGGQTIDDAAPGGFFGNPISGGQAVHLYSNGTNKWYSW